MKTIVEWAKPVFEMGLAIKDGGYSDAESLQKALLASVDEFGQKISAQGATKAMVEECRYALLAWLDEIVFSESIFSIDWFSFSLVMKEFEDPAAGVHFFTRLEKLHQLNDRLEVLKLYGFCLLLGFQGRYRLENTVELKNIIADVFKKFPEQAEPMAFLKNSLQQADKPQGGNQTKIMLWFSLAFFVIACALYALNMPTSG